MIFDVRIITYIICTPYDDYSYIRGDGDDDDQKDSMTTKHSKQRCVCIA